MTHSTSNNQWQADTYDHKLDFVSKMGGDVLSLLQPQPGERVLDIGCGTADLTAKIAAAGAVTVGIDLSPEMIARARDKYPYLSLSAQNAYTYRAAQPFDAVFSNAALHWMKDAHAVAVTVASALRDGGRFVAEFGGYRNVAALVSATESALTAHGYDPQGRNPWYFPTIGQYAAVLEEHGFLIMLAQHFERPTPLHGESGVRDWLDMMADDFFYDVSAEHKAAIYQAVEDQLRPEHYRQGQWIADYRRLRVCAVKQAN
ncbi:methyltransferase domain-containing protein [Paenibacillus tritici]|uniref:Methyltransferase domain-containing protein n=1 Tax=Paenibacillus tritici TaxID=1873425 RepID=A0ABX2DY94_9BACL|nr:methyltransferase [Paenibacillus tritici]NQX49695.1 methyltransferase domain-containing protein [Paenibacillus tritici]